MHSDGTLQVSPIADTVVYTVAGGGVAVGVLARDDVMELVGVFEGVAEGDAPPLKLGVHEGVGLGLEKERHCRDTEPPPPTA